MIDNAKKQLLNLKEGILLGLSGGPDSMCLCALLMEAKIKFHIAHIDHGIFPASTKEKERLEIFAEKNSIPFHLCSLNGAAFPKNNLEEVLRDKRLEFFSSVMKKNSLKILLLGHQKDERAETMIKRFFEGGSLFNLSGIKRDATFKEIKIFRPLLGVCKESIIMYLKQRGIPYYTDLSNFSGDNLRAKMRRSLIPKLTEEFGKNIVSSICDLGDQVEEMSAYFQKRIENSKKRAINGKYGIFYPYIDEEDPYFFSLMILAALKEKSILVSRKQRLYIKEAVAKKEFGKSLIFGEIRLYFEKVGVFFVDCKVVIPKIGFLEEDVNWLTFWKGEGANLKIKRVLEEKDKDLIDKKKLSEYYRKHKTPIWMRPLLPIPYSLYMYRLSKYCS
jgi:tRNA(Ile)-lysidine synthase